MSKIPEVLVVCATALIITNNIVWAGCFLGASALGALIQFSQRHENNKFVLANMKLSQSLSKQSYNADITSMN